MNSLDMHLLVRNIIHNTINQMPDNSGLKIGHFYECVALLNLRDEIDAAVCAISLAEIGRATVKAITPIEVTEMPWWSDGEGVFQAPDDEDIRQHLMGPFPTMQEASIQAGLGWDPDDN